MDAKTPTVRPNSLIGPAVYPTFIRLLTRLEAIIVPIVFVAVGLASVVGEASPWQVLASAANAALMAGIQVAFWVTVVFAVIERTGSAPASWALEQTSTARREVGVSTGELVGSTIGLALLTGFLVWQPGYQATWGDDDSFVPILDPALNEFWIPWLVVVIVMSLVLTITVFLHGRWTIWLAVANTVLNLAFAGPVIWLLLNDRVLSPQFVDAMAQAPVPTPTFVPTLLAWIFAGVAVLDSAQSWWRALGGSTTTQPGRMGTWTSPQHP